MTITIPTWRNPYEVEINGQKYSYEAGVTTDVPNAVAEVIQRDIAAHTDTAAPQMVQPRWGKYKKKETKGFIGYHGEWAVSPVEAHTCTGIQMTKEEYEAAKAANAPIYATYLHTTEEDNTSIIPWEIAPEYNDDAGAMLFENYDDSYEIRIAEFEFDVEWCEPIPSEYMAVDEDNTRIIPAVMTLYEDVEEGVTNISMTSAEIVKLLGNGIPVICISSTSIDSAIEVGFAKVDGDGNVTANGYYL